MKASLIIRENEDPLFKSKLPVKILGFPFRSSMEASTNSKELCLSFSTASEYGPSFKLNYRPNDPSRPFGFVLKTGAGHFGSAVGSPISVSAEFNFIRDHVSPRFFFHFKPQFGDFTNKQKIASDMNFPSLRVIPHDSNMKKSDTLIANTTTSTSDDENQEMKMIPWTRMLSLSNGLEAAKSLIGSGKIYARTAVPVRDMAVVNLRWGLKFPVSTSAVAMEDKNDRHLSKKKMPYFVLHKIGIEHVSDSREIENDGGDAVEACLGVKKEELASLRNENELLKKDFDKFKSEIGLGGWTKEEEVVC